jgi:DNA-binding NarL/FixJ family response regulator
MSGNPSETLQIVPPEPVTVLLCEDNPSFRLLVRLWIEDDPESLELIGAVERAADGLELAREQHPDVVLMDHGLPDAESPKVLVARLREASPTSRVLLFSGQDPSRLARLATDLGTDGFIPKGVSAATFRSRLLD